MSVSVERMGSRLFGVFLEDNTPELLTGVTTQIDPDLALSLNSAELFQQTLPTVCILNLDSFSTYPRCHFLRFESTGTSYTLAKQDHHSEMGRIRAN